jgi:hypothetical protein
MKWIWRSALQKAVRRGQRDLAIRYGRRLLAIEPTYFWRALAVIAVEDVGFADPDAVTFTTAAISKTVRDRLAHDQGLANALIQRMCAPIKSRACCELSIAVDMGRPDIIKRLSDLDDHSLARSVADDNMGVAYAALGLIRGQFQGYPSRDVSLRPLVEETILDRLSGHPSQARAAIHAFRRPVDTMSFGMLPVAVHALRQPDLTIQDERDSWPDSHLVGGVPAEALDLHTRHGGLALKAFYTSLAAHHLWLTAIPAQAAVKALGAAVFVEEGGLVDRRLTSGSLGILQETQDQALLTAYGVPPDLHQPVRNLVKAELPRLLDKRRWAMGLDNQQPWTATP